MGQDPFTLSMNYLGQENVIGEISIVVETTETAREEA